ncbi:MAG: hypothetical protein GF320_19130 [Armatimonadia bacterium]|nr:hypothetical protein [Armatimonadia bacterium]
MARHPTDKKVRRAIERHNERVAEAAAARLAELPPAELAERANQLLRPLGWTETQETAPVDDGILLKGTVAVGLSTLPAVALVRTSDQDLGPERLAEVLRDAGAEVRIVQVACLGTPTDEALEMAAGAAPLCVLHDRASTLRLILESRTLVQQAPVPPVFLMETQARQQKPGPKTTASGKTDRRGRAARLFHWRLEERDGTRYALHGDFIPDPSQSFTIERDLVAPDGDFGPARRELHEAICGHLQRIFPDLPKSRIRTKAWAGVHKVYPAKVYGKQ